VREPRGVEDRGMPAPPAIRQLDCTIGMLGAWRAFFLVDMTRTSWATNHQDCDASRFWLSGKASRQSARIWPHFRMYLSEKSVSGQMTGNFGSELSQILDQASGGRWRGIASFARRTETSSEPGSHQSMRSWVRMIPPTTILQLSPERFSSALNTFFATRFSR
jgi:hypothetical protein